jgi:hypothetical protein
MPTQTGMPSLARKRACVRKFPDKISLFVIDMVPAPERKVCVDGRRHWWRVALISAPAALACSNRFLTFPNYWGADVLPSLP